MTLHKSNKIQETFGFTDLFDNDHFFNNGWFGKDLKQVLPAINTKVSILETVIFR